MKKNIILQLLFLLIFWNPSHSRTRTMDNLADAKPIKSLFLSSFITGDQLYLNIPEPILDKPMLFVRYEGNYRRKHMQVVWSRHQDKIVLKPQSIKSTAGIIIPFKRKVPLMENILAIFPVENKEGSPNSYCINITDLVLHLDIEWPQFPGGFSGNAIPQISLLLGAKDFEDQVLIKTSRGTLKDGSKVSSPIFLSFCALGEPMKARRHDYRMGYYNEEVFGIGYGIDTEGTQNDIANISRWRLEKKYKDQKISVPVKPITFLLAPEIPKVWRPYVIAGIREWLPAFEAAGFKDAIVVKETDRLSDWDRHNIHNNIVYWSPRKYFRGNEKEDDAGKASFIKDYRTGEILRSDIILGAARHTFENFYFTRAAPLDKRAQKLPFPDSLLGELFQQLTAHETGHALGIMDNNYGEAQYPVKKMNDIAWLKTMGFTPSVMNSTRANNIPQPEDSIPPDFLISKVGPTDVYAIQWGYSEFTEGLDEKTALERIVRLQDSIPWYRYNTSPLEVVGPANTNEVVETNDPIRSTQLAMKNLKRTIALLPQACSNTKDNVRLEDLYKKCMELWYLQMRQVVSLIGGYDIQYKSLDQPGKIYTPMALKSQKEALAYILTNAFDPPEWLTNPAFSTRINYSSYPDYIVSYQQKLLHELLRPQRFKRFEYLETVNGYQKSLINYLTALQSGIFSEIQKDPVPIGRRKQEIQMTYLDKIKAILEQERINVDPDRKAMDYTDYSKGLLLQQLVSLRKEIENHIKKSEKVPSSGHWKLSLKKIKDIL
ncbi:zinc-dependent metalloprotease [Maribacter polysaccharolyticus]|uniref:zinc-dependent metalloprotease n=1 Tax=Maribacter polysaccharolyticus TaxID=3020831 RepID=UPI00237EFBBF|nr:zinc-dependent metalloprotease [Maribacter polysaccharolyticus]MDE3741150.1 zinc-dependent metalloprotease [Maribacter polysaccharolyticus]